LLQTFEVNFAYNDEEGGGHRERRNALVKLRLCASCAPKLKTKRLLEKESAQEEKEDHSQSTSGEDNLLSDLIL
jgi:hypothetical protein